MLRPRVIETPIAWWQKLDLAWQFVIMGALVMTMGMAVIGAWVTGRIEDGAIANSAAATALYVDSVVSPLFLSVSQNGTLGEGGERALDETLAQGRLGERLVVFKIWQADGTISFSTDETLRGQKFAIGGKLAEAFSGTVAAEFDHLDDEENAGERRVGVPLLEIYSPIRTPWSGEVVAVAEFYEIAQDLSQELTALRIQSWLVVLAVTAAMVALLFLIVRNGSRTIASQRRALQDRVGELTRLLDTNRQLRRTVEVASARVAASNEQTLRRLSADLHDGPTQLLALASMRLGSKLHDGAGLGDAQREDLEKVQHYLAEALREMRALCQGLGMPDIANLSLNRVIEMVVRTHETRTGHAVTMALPSDAVAADMPLRICVYRFVQEALNNGSRHAGGAALTVTLTRDADAMLVTVSDGGTGFEPEQASDRLGLSGLRERVESLGGTFSIRSDAAGTTVSGRLPLQERTGS